MVSRYELVVVMLFTILNNCYAAAEESCPANFEGSRSDAAKGSAMLQKKKVVKNAVASLEEADPHMPNTKAQTINAFQKWSKSSMCYEALAGVAKDEGPHIETMRYTTLDDCKKKCNGDSRCNSFAACPGDGNRCYLKTKVLASDEAVGDVGRGCKSYREIPCNSFSPWGRAAWKPPRIAFKLPSWIKKLQEEKKRKTECRIKDPAWRCKGMVCLSDSQRKIVDDIKFYGIKKYCMPASSSTCRKKDMSACRGTCRCHVDCPHACGRCPP